MRLLDLTMPLDHAWMPDELFPTAVQFLLGPKQDPEKGITLGTESGACLLLPAQFARFRTTRRLSEVPVSTLVLWETAVVDVPKGPREPITEADLASGLREANYRDGDALLLRTGWGEGAPRQPQAGGSEGRQFVFVAKSSGPVLDSPRGRWGGVLF